MLATLIASPALAQAPASAQPAAQVAPAPGDQAASLAVPASGTTTLDTSANQPNPPGAADT